VGRFNVRAQDRARELRLEHGPGSRGGLLPDGCRVAVDCPKRFERSAEPLLTRAST
jgi:hypothetical protein